jgi:hypothetical protein
MQPSEMLPGARYRLDASILSVYRRDDRHIFLRIPAGEEVSVLGDKPGTPFIKVRWQSEVVQMFAHDLNERAQQLTGLGVIAELLYKQLAVCA